jgi:hypothetical protein
MTAIIGKLDPFSETGTEGVIWSLHENGKEGYDGLHCLGEGDHLTVYDPVDNTKVVWQGNIDLEYERNYRPFPMNPEYGQQEVGGMWVHGIQRTVTPEDWGTWFYKQYPAELVKCEIGRLWPCEGSSTILGQAWDGKGSVWNGIHDKGDLIVKFKNSGYYRYKDVDSDTYWEFHDAPSKGKYHATNIKNKFVVEKIELPKAEHKGYSINQPKPWAKYPEENFDAIIEWTAEEEEEFIRLMEDKDQ